MKTQQERAGYIVRLYQKLNPDTKVDSNTTIKNTTIWRLCETSGGPFQRIRKWTEAKVNALEGNVVINDFREQVDENFRLFEGRQKKYGDSWKVLTIPAIANLVEMKMHRIANMDIKDIDPKIEDEFRDGANYCVFGLLKLLNK